MMKKICIPSLLLFMMGLVMPWAIPNAFAAKLTPADCRTIIEQAEDQANLTGSKQGGHQSKGVKSFVDTFFPLR